MHPITTQESLRRFGLVPSDQSLPAIRSLLAREVAAERAGEPREEDLALLCCVQLFSRGLLEDVLRIWEAKRSGFDLGASLDVELLCGAGVEPTKRYLAGQTATEAPEALALIVKCETDQLAGFCPADQLERYKAYFGAP